jgi:hypothetical protein
VTTIQKAARAIADRIDDAYKCGDGDADSVARAIERKFGPLMDALEEITKGTYGSDAADFAARFLAQLAGDAQPDKEKQP